VDVRVVVLNRPMAVGGILQSSSFSQIQNVCRFIN